jgi:bifunctional UDP-N-acetylglucosamine pyrophosphorylase/glucosamine-1-phosphate N-acetyltransferase
MGLSIVILAAGKGTRMRTGLPKVLHCLAGKTLLERVVTTAQSLHPSAIYVVYGNSGELVRQEMAHLNVQWVEQAVPQGTGHAVLQALPHFKENEQVLVLYGDVPLISHHTLQHLLDSTLKNALGLVVAEFDNPTGLGRIVRNEMGNIVEIVEQKDANEQQLKIQEINTGIMTTSVMHLREWLPKLTSYNAQGEYYLTDIVAMAVADGFSVGGVMAQAQEEVRGINNLSELASLERYYQSQKAYELMLQGVTIMDPQRLDVRGDLQIAADVTIDINVIIEGQVTIAKGASIGANSILRNVTIGENVKIEPNCIIEDTVIDANAAIGPFARIRPGTHISHDVRIGNFVEIKKSFIGAGSKAAHLSYLGDAHIGNDVIIGCGVVTVNYDGLSKAKTVIKDNAFVGCDSQLIAPVTIGEGAYIAAGSTITTDAPAHQLTISRGRQRSIAGWKPGKKKVEV